MLMDRRRFLESLGLLGGSTLAACNAAPAERLAAYLDPPREMTPGTAAFWATVCRACPAGCGLLVKTREARPIKLEGNPLHPVNRGRLCARGQASIQGLYSRHRAKQPLLRSGDQLVPVSWDRALATVTARLQKAKSAALLTGLESGAFEDTAADLMAGFETGQFLMYEPVSARPLAKAAEILFGTDEVPVIDLESADHVVSLGVDFMDTWLSPVQHTRQWAGRHAYANGRRLVVEYFGPRRNLTANAADQWHRFPIRDLGPVALAMTRGLLEARRSALAPELSDRITAVLDRLENGRLDAKRHAEVVEPIVTRLAKAEMGTVLYGARETTTEDSTTIAALTLLANYLTGALGTSLRFGERYAYSKLAAEQQVIDLLSTPPNVLLIHGTNPAYTLPGAPKVADKLGAAPFVVVLAQEIDETARHADVVLPVHHPLEAWGDFEVTSQIAGVMQPVRMPLYPTRHPGDLLIELGRRLGRPLPRETFKDYVVARWAQRAGLQPELAADRRAFDRALVAGGQFPEDHITTIDSSRPEAAGGSAPPPVLAAGPADAAPKLAVDTSWDDLRLTTVVPRAGEADLLIPLSAALYDGRGTGQDWLLEVPDSLNQTAWEVPAEIAWDVATTKGIRDGDRVELRSQEGEVVAAAIVVPDLAPGTVALRLGGGRSAGARANDNQVDSGNAMGLVGDFADRLCGQIAVAQTSVALTRIAGGTLARVSGGQESADRQLCLAINLDDADHGRFPRLGPHGEVRAGAGASAGHPPAVAAMPDEEDPFEGTRPADNMVALYRHAQHRWGMVIDLDRCTGCGACVVACYAENNIPVVGRQEILRGRELSWLRIEQHVFGKGNARQVRFLPVMCQHCDQAPCEAVCPVFAAYHTQDGLNAQVYNRCVGTRYCANNCPYKVRRFNYFDYRREDPGNQQLNPDVTVRTRGVMEKCTFCIQRIRGATNRAKADGREIADGDIHPACVQTCPTGALTFGDFRDPESAMTKLAKNPRGYRLLDHVVNTRPAVVYLRKVYSRPEEV